MRSNLEKYVSDLHHRPPTSSRPKPNQKQVEIITTFWHHVETRYTNEGKKHHSRAARISIIRNVGVL